MDNTKEVIWSREASNKVDSIKEYVLENWSEKEFQDFLKKLALFEKHVLKFAKLFPKSVMNPSLRKAVISKNHSVIYEIREERILVITILDNHQKN